MIGGFGVFQNCEIFWKRLGFLDLMFIGKEQNETVVVMESSKRPQRVSLAKVGLPIWSVNKKIHQKNNLKEEFADIPTFL